MHSLKETLRLIAEHGYRIEHLPGALPFSDDVKKNFLIKQYLMRIAVHLGEIATLSENTEQKTNEQEILLKDSTIKLIIESLSLAQLQNISEEEIYRRMHHFIEAT